MKNVTLQKLLIAGILFLPLLLSAQDKSRDSSYAHAHYLEREEYFRKMPDHKNEIVFLGNSITEHGKWQEIINKKGVVNRGIGGDNTFGILARLDEVLSSKPQKIFLLIGINDLSRRLPFDVIVRNYQRIIKRVREGSPATTLYIQSILPVNDKMTTAPYLKGISPLIVELNKRLKSLASAEKIPYIDLKSLFDDGNGQLKETLSRDGIHLKPEAYIAWVNYLKAQKYL